MHDRHANACQSSGRIASLRFRHRFIMGFPVGKSRARSRTYTWGTARRVVSTSIDDLSGYHKETITRTSSARGAAIFIIQLMVLRIKVTLMPVNGGRIRRNKWSPSQLSQSGPLGSVSINFKNGNSGEDGRATAV